MALQDLTPQLRTRLSRVERAVGWFIIFAAVLLLSGFGYYLHNTAERKGWFKIKATYFTYTDSAAGLKEGDPVKLMGLDVGQITRMAPMRPWFDYNIYVEFEIKEPYYDYLWTVGSRARVASADLLGKRELEVTKGTAGHPAYLFRVLKKIAVSDAQTLPNWGAWRLGEDLYDQAGTNLVVPAWSPLSNSLPAIAKLGLNEIRVVDARGVEKQKAITAVWNDKEGRYDPYYKDKTNYYWLKSEESAAVTERLESLIGSVQEAIPNITNQLAIVLSNSASLTSNLNAVALSARPAVSNIAAATSNLDHPGALGEWLLPTNITLQLETTLTTATSTLGTANTTLTNVNTNLTFVLQDIGRSLDSLADLTSNLNHQVQQNPNILSNISKSVVDTDELVQGLKRHWLFRSAFKTKATNSPPAKPKQ